jgi:hypothetical protein
LALAEGATLVVRSLELGSLDVLLALEFLLDVLVSLENSKGRGFK